jgi:hypothetical protein
VRMNDAKEPTKSNMNRHILYPLHCNIHLHRGSRILLAAEVKVIPAILNMEVEFFMNFKPFEELCKMR